MSNLHHYGEGGDTLKHFIYKLDARGNRVRALEADNAGTAASTLVTTVTNPDGSKLLRFYGHELTLTFNTGTSKGMVDIYIGEQLWGTFDTYAASSGQTALVIDCPEETEQWITLVPSAEKNPASTGYTFDLDDAEALTHYDVHWHAYTYDTLARLQEAVHYDHANVLPLEQYLYTYDRANNRLSQRRDELDSGSLVTGTTINYIYNAINQLTEENDFLYVYDDNGNRLHRKFKPTATYLLYKWDRANRLIEFDVDNMGVPYNAHSYKYNGLGQRVWQQDDQSGAITYLLDTAVPNYQVIQETRYTPVRYIHDPLGIAARENTDGTWQWMLKDGLGSVRVRVDETGDVVSSPDYSPYGYAGAIFGFAGELGDASGLLNLRARYYDPATAQFMSLDPLELVNRYMYVDANPLNMIDPSGFQCGFSGESHNIHNQMTSSTLDSTQNDEVLYPYGKGLYKPLPLPQSICNQLLEPFKGQCNQLENEFDVHLTLDTTNPASRWLAWQVSIVYNSVNIQGGSLSKIVGGDKSSAFKQLFPNGWNLIMTQSSDLQFSAASARYCAPGLNDPYCQKYTEQAPSRNVIVFFGNGLRRWESEELGAAQAQENNSRFAGIGRWIPREVGGTVDWKIGTFSISLVTHEMGHGFNNLLVDVNKERVDSPNYSNIQSLGRDLAIGTYEGFYDIQDKLPDFPFGDPQTGRNWSDNGGFPYRYSEFVGESYAAWALGYLPLSDPFSASIASAIEKDILDKAQ